MDWEMSDFGPTQQKHCTPNFCLDIHLLAPVGWEARVWAALLDPQQWIPESTVSCVCPPQGCRIPTLMQTCTLSAPSLQTTTGFTSIRHSPSHSHFLTHILQKLQICPKFPGPQPSPFSLTHCCVSVSGGQTTRRSAKIRIAQKQQVRSASTRALSTHRCT